MGRGNGSRHPTPKEIAAAKRELKAMNRPLKTTAQRAEEKRKKARIGKARYRAKQRFNRTAPQEALASQPSPSQEAAQSETAA
jgi:hypothetical protein